MRSPVGFGGVAQGEGGAGVGGDERLAEFIERTCHGPLGLPLARSGLQARCRYRLSDGLADRLAGMDARTDAVIKV